MTVHEFGKENKDAMLLIHPSVVKWDYFEYVIPLLEDRYHLIVPALPGYDFEQPGDTFRHFPFVVTDCMEVRTSG